MNPRAVARDAAGLLLGACIMAGLLTAGYRTLFPRLADMVHGRKR